MGNLASVFGSIIKSITDVILDVLTFVWEDVVVPIIKTIAGVFGIKDEDIVKTSVSSQRVLDDVDMKNLITKNVLSKVTSGRDYVDVFKEFDAAGRGRMSSSHYYANKVGRIPSTNAYIYSIDQVALDNVLGSLFTAPVVVAKKLDVPNKIEFVNYTFQNDYNYEPSLNILTYTDGFKYSITSITYNYGTNNYDVVIIGSETVTTLVEGVTTTTSTAIDGTTETKTVVIDNVTTVTGTRSGTISTSTDNVSSTSTVETLGSTTESVATVIMSTDVLDNQDVIGSNIIVAVPAFVPNDYVVVQYYTYDINLVRYWLYDTTTGVYPSLEDSVVKVTELDMMPIITLRNDKVNTNSNKTSSEYKENKKLASILGINIDDMITNVNDNPDIDGVNDAFIHFGVSPSDPDPVISTVLYQMFDDLVSSNVVSGTTGYSATFESNPMKIGLGWHTQTKTSATGSIGALHSYSHEISADGKDLIMKYQVLVNSYNIITITKLSNITFIQRGSLYGTTNVALTDTEFNIPISYLFIKKLSGTKQRIFLAKALRITFYGLVLEHIKWYQTGVFAVFIQIIGIIIIIVGCVISACTLSTLGMALLIGAGASIALKMIAKYVHTPWLRAVLTIIVMVVAIYASGGFDMGTLSTAQSLTLGVTEAVAIGAAGVEAYTSAKVDQLQNKKGAFTTASARRYSEFDKAKEDQNKSLVSADFAARLANMDTLAVSAMGTAAVQHYMYIQAQYEWDILFDVGYSIDSFVDSKLKIKYM